MALRSKRVVTLWAAAVVTVAVKMAGWAPAAGERAGSFHGVFTETPVGSWARVSSALTNARSVVVHEPGSGARIACADLQ